MTTLQSAISTLHIVYSQANKDTAKVLRFGQSIYAALTSTEALKTYKAIYRALEIVWLCLVLAYTVLQEMTEKNVQSQLIEPKLIAESMRDELIPSEIEDPEMEIRTVKNKLVPTIPKMIPLYSEVTVKQLKEMLLESECPPIGIEKMRKRELFELVYG
jgi:hypothetical protein